MVRCVADLDALSERLAPRILTAGRNGNESLLSNGQSQTVSAPLKNMLRHIPTLDGHVPACLPYERHLSDHFCESGDEPCMY
jgi:hypothetical protein